MATVMTCWKEIASYLGRGVRTVQRWEFEHGLPVRRIGTKAGKNGILAIPAEIDLWVLSRRVRIEGHSFRELDFAMLTSRISKLEEENTRLRSEIANIRSQFADARDETGQEQPRVAA